MKVREFAHVVLKVRDLDRSLRFYRDTLGLPVAQIATLNGRRMAFFKIGPKHHDFAIMELGADLHADDNTRAGVVHVAFNIGDQDDLEVLRKAKAEVQAAGYEIVRATQHFVTLSLYIRDPDGIVVELFVDRNPAVYANMPEYLGAGSPALAL
jgi:catechol 2,3-dioxygenase